MSPKNTKSGSLEFPESTTMMSLALGQAESELFNGRDDAQSVVILIAGTSPMSPKNTKSAAAKLQQSAKVLYVPAGHTAPMSLFEEMASEPKEDHIIRARSLWSLTQPNILNTIIA